METDPALEIRAWRDEFARAHDYDLARISAAIHESASRFAGRFIFISPDSPAGESRSATALDGIASPLEQPGIVNRPSSSAGLEISAL